MNTAWAGTERALRTADGVTISAARFDGLAGSHDDLCFVVAHGFTGHWRQPRVRRVVERLRGTGCVVAIDMRGHGRSGGDSTVGDAEVHDLVRAAREAALQHGDVLESVGRRLQAVAPPAAAG